MRYGRLSRTGTIDSTYVLRVGYLHLIFKFLQSSSLREKIKSQNVGTDRF